MSGALPPGLFGAPGGYAVRILDLSGANGADPVETVTGFRTLEHANAFARRYVRDSVDRCRGRGMDAAAVIAAWGVYGEDAEVVGGAEAAWRSANELAGFAAAPATDPEARDWRAIDPRRLGDDADDVEEDDAEDGDGDGDGE